MPKLEHAYGKDKQRHFIFNAVLLRIFMLRLKCTYPVVFSFVFACRLICSVYVSRRHNSFCIRSKIGKKLGGEILVHSVLFR